MKDRIVNYTRAGYSGLYIVSHEELRVEAAVAEALTELNKDLPEDDMFRLHAWSVTEGLTDLSGSAEKIGDTEEPSTMLETFIKSPPKTIYIVRDFHLFVEDKNPLIWRKLKDALSVGRASNKVLVILGCRYALPIELEKEFAVLDFALPSREGLRVVLRKLLEENGHSVKSLGDEEAGILSAAAGLTTTEAENAFSLSIVERGKVCRDIVFREKCQAVKKNGLLEVVESSVTLDDIGGLVDLKHWLLERRDAFSDAARAYGLPTPKGFLAVGNPGCLHPDTPIYDPVDGSTRTVAARHADNLPFHVVALSDSGPVIAAADAPFKYPEAPMLRLTTDEGSITVTRGHKLLTVDGWLDASECAARFRTSGRVLLRSLASPGPAESLRDGLRWTRKLAGSLFDCSPGHRPGGERPRFSTGDDRGAAPSRDDALGHTRDGSRPGGSVGSGANTRPYPESDRPSTPGSSDRSGPSSPPTASTTSKHDLSTSRTLPQSHPDDARLPGISGRSPRAFPGSTLAPVEAGESQASPGVSVAEQTVDAEASPTPVTIGLRCGDSSSGSGQLRELSVLPGIAKPRETCVLPGDVNSSPVPEGFSLLRQVETVETCCYYDFHVPLLENYWACGMFHHNTGKTLTAKACKSVFDLPLLRLDAAKLFGSLVGQSEGNWRAVHSTAKAMAPCILHIDEVDGAMSGGSSSGSTDGGTTSRVIKSILQDMQDNSEGIFYVLTANDVDNLPSPLLRRMDEVWNVELPRVDERAAVWSIQIARVKRDPKKFDVAKLATQSEGYSGAEIQKLVSQALYHAFADKKREPTTEDMLFLMETFSPMSKTMAADIERRTKRLEGVARLANGSSGPKPTARGTRRLSFPKPEAA